MGVDAERVKKVIEEGRAVVGIELGSTRIKTVLIDDNHVPVATGSYDWENKLENHIWTYSLEDIWEGLKGSYQDMARGVKEKYGTGIRKLGGIGFSAMMHGYMAFDETGSLLVPFRTWRNTITGQAAGELTELFQYNVPQRWSIAHLYQAILNGESHVKDVRYFTTLSGYIHWQLTGRKVLGIGDASGMFPINIGAKDFDEGMVQKFDELVKEKGYPWKLRQIMPEVLTAGEDAGVLTEEGAKLLDPSGELEAGITVCPPEGDAGTGMIATNSVSERTGNVSAGTSVFAMIVLEKELSRVHTEIDMVTTPNGSLVAMAHANNCTSDLNAWVSLFREYSEAMGIKADMNQIFSVLYNKALEGDADCGGLLSYGYYSGENIIPIDEGRPLFVRTPDSRFNLANFMRTHLYAALGALKIGMDILVKEEKIQIDKILGHGGLFKTPGVGQRIMAAAMQAPVSVMETAGEGGAWGIAVLAAYAVKKAGNESLESYLDYKVFAGKEGMKMEPDAKDIEGFEKFIETFKKGLSVEQEAISKL
ncbi:xylulokinase [[Clostridium] scindens]|uniref:xylulokinase n=1 Tax=Clostridium scindens (strain JCM 10418 / VPI 12708) TaxID=29347 RepID=UPI00242F5A38|nr:FGGY-family carbohydrate kinase [[Clostridium] scindens]